MGTKNYEVGYKKPPKDKQFGKPNGNKRREGFWDIKATPRYKLEQMMKLTEQELVDISQDDNAPYFEHKLATCIIKGQWKEIEGMINQVYGTPKQTIDVKEIQAPTPLEDLQVVKVEKKKK